MEVKISDLMVESGVGFGTSGVRGLVPDMTDLVCYVYTRGFLQYLDASGVLNPRGAVALAGDLRESTPRIMASVARAIADAGYRTVFCGHIPTPAISLYGFKRAIPSIMVTGSHIPDDRNGIKFNKPSGEILKQDEAKILAQTVEVDLSIFCEEGFSLPEEQFDARAEYVDRYVKTFPEDCLNGKKIGIYQHSAVGRDILIEIFSGLGADVTPLGFSTTFMAVDTEAIRQEDINLACEWSFENRFDAIISTDGDSDRPLISDEYGNWVRGDVLGILAAKYLKVDSVVLPVSCNTVVEKCGYFSEIFRTKIGSPFVIAKMEEVALFGSQRVAGYEANGGFLTASPLSVFGRELPALPTRDAVLPILALLLLSIQERSSISSLLNSLPNRYTGSGLLKEMGPSESQAILSQLKDRPSIESVFCKDFGAVKSIDRTDGLRITFESLDVLHVRPSGNAPEFRCYTESSSEERVDEMQKTAMHILLEMKGL